LLHIQRLRPDGKWQAKHGDVVINWGSTSRPERIRLAHIVNDPQCVRRAANKLVYFTEMRDMEYMPFFTTDMEEARQYMEETGCDMIERHVLNGHKGMGIEVRKFADLLTPAPLYVEYIKKRDEYRIHIMNGEILSKNKKGIRKGQENDVNYQIRNYHEGWIYLRDREVPNAVCNVALDAVKTLGLDFGAVDVLWNQKRERAVPIEVNTAPGLTASLLHLYQERIKENYFSD
jgi:glutathione synthase/RimK-type ligase-like ATP-grasp enzyme